MHKIRLLTLLTFLLFTTTAPAQEPPDYKAPSKEVIDAWTKAGAEYGACESVYSGYFVFIPKIELSKGELPGFSIKGISSNMKLPDGGVPFGLQIESVDDAGLKQLTALSSLHTLLVSDTRFTGTGLKHLAGLKFLQSLYLYNTRVTDEGLKEVVGVKSLQTLNLAGTQVTDAGLKQIEGLQALQTLNLSTTLVGDAGLKHLTGLESLRTIDLTSP
jgi:hypothetical protein